MLKFFEFEESKDEEVKFTTLDQTWFKFLALITFICALITNAAFIWLLVCRPKRLEVTDDEIKKLAILDDQKRNRTKQNQRQKKIDLKKKLKYLILGNLKILSPKSSILTESSYNEKGPVIKSNSECKMDELDETARRGAQNESKDKKTDKNIKKSTAKKIKN